LLAGAFVGGEAFIPLMLVEEKNTPLLWAGAALTIGSLGWMAGSWLQSRTWLRLRRDRIITVGCGSVVASLIWVASAPPHPHRPGGWRADGILAGFGMGLATASTALAVTWLSRESEQGRNGSSLNLSDALGSALFVGVSGTLFAALRSGHDGPFTFAACSSPCPPWRCWHWQRHSDHTAHRPDSRPDAIAADAPSRSGSLTQAAAPDDTVTLLRRTPCCPSSSWP
jgi:MFS family permease